jgi:hypothetical protein
MGLIKKIKCRNCSKLFIPDYRNRERQKYCNKPECKKASKAASQKKWLSKPENKDYFRGPEHVQRVQDWREAKSGYSKRNRSKSEKTLQDSLTPQYAENKRNNNHFTKFALQDSLNVQPAVIIGLIAQITGSTLQENIAETLLRMQQLGQDVLSCKPYNKGGKNYDFKVCNSAEPGAQSP